MKPGASLATRVPSATRKRYDHARTTWRGFAHLWSCDLLSGRANCAGSRTGRRKAPVRCQLSLVRDGFVGGDLDALEVGAHHRGVLLPDRNLLVRERLT